MNRGNAELKDGSASTGLIFSSDSMAQKFGGAIQSPEALDGLKYLMSFIPAAIAALSILILLIYPLDKKTDEKHQQSIKAYSQIRQKLIQ